MPTYPPTMRLERNGVLLEALGSLFDDFSSDMFDCDEGDSKFDQTSVDDGFNIFGLFHPTPEAPKKSTQEVKELYPLNTEPSSITLTNVMKARVKDNMEPPVLNSASLHHACCKPNVSTSEIEFLLRRDPLAPSRSVVLKSLKSVYSPILKNTTKKIVKEPYTYPLHIAIMHKVSSAVIEVLIDAAPQILCTPDGSLQETPLAVFLRYHPHNIATFDKMLLECPESAAVTDKYGNTLAHIGARYGVDVAIMRHIRILHPQSLNARNFHGMTAVEVAQKYTASSSDALAHFLWQQQAKNHHHSYTS